MTETLKQTSLHARHVAAGARIVPFGGWDMPVQYAGIVEEHRAVRANAGVFDVSHMGEFWLEGPQVLEELNALLCNDPRRLVDGQALYSPMCNDRGGIVDDLLLYRFAADRFLLVVNASRREADLAWVKTHLARSSVRDASSEIALIAVQGPRAPEIVQSLTTAGLSTIGYYHFLPNAEVAGVRAIVSRTGYTGEDGFELYVDWNEAGKLWDALRGKEVPPAGLGARDTLRLEAGYLLYGNDMDESTSPIEAGLAWTVKLEDRTFVGSEVVRQHKERGVTRVLAGFALRERAIARHGAALLKDGAPAGVVTSGTFAPSIEKSVGLGYVPPALAAPGTLIAADVRGRSIEAEIVKLPFYRRTRRTKL